MAAASDGPGRGAGHGSSREFEIEEEAAGAIAAGAAAAGSSGGATGARQQRELCGCCYGSVYYGRIKKTVAKFIQALLSAAAVFCRGVLPRGEDGGLCPSVELIEPPCQVVEERCSVVLSMSRALRLAEAPWVELWGGGRMVDRARLVSGRGSSVSLSIPPLSVGGACLVVKPDLLPTTHERIAPPVNMLALPREAADEVCQLFDRMVAETKTNASRSRTDSLNDGTDQELARDRALKTKVWASHFQPFCADFAATLGSLSSGRERMHGECVNLARYLLSQRMWTTASFLMTVCLRAGACVSLGPFALEEEDVGSQSLREQFLSVGGEGYGLAADGRASLLGVGEDRSLSGRSQLSS